MHPWRSVGVAALTIGLFFSIPASGAQSSGEVRVSAAADGQLQVELSLDGELLRMRLRPHSLRSDDFELLRVDAQGLQHRLPVPEPTTFRGDLTKGSRGRVAASYRDGRLRALVDFDRGRDWSVEPDGGGGHVLRPVDLSALRGTCEAVEPSTSEGFEGQRRGPGSEGGCTALAEIALEADWALFQRNGESLAATVADVETILNAVDLIYGHHVGITYQLTTLVVQSSAAEDRYAFAGSGVLLNAFQDYWNSRMGSVQRDVAHLLTAVDRGGPAIGVAYIGVVCDLAWAYGWSQLTAPDLGGQVGLVSHELGHNWSARHCDGLVDCNIMCSFIGLCAGDLELFGERAVENIARFRDERVCLGAGSGTALPASPVVGVDRGGTLVDQAVQLDVLANDRDANCEVLVITEFDALGAAGGSISRSVGSGPEGRDQLLYTPAPGFAGQDRFDYVVSDPGGLGARGTVEVGVFALEPGVEVPDAVAGVRASYYVYTPLELSALAAVPDFDRLVPYDTGLVETVDFPESSGEVVGSGRIDAVGAVFTGRIVLDEPGTWTFYTESDDGSLLYVDGIRVVDNDGGHAMRERSGSIELAAGPHDVRVEYYEANFSGGLIVRLSGPGVARQVVPAAMWVAPGVAASYYDLSQGTLPDFTAIEPYAQGSVDVIDFPVTTGSIAGSGRADDVAVLFEGYVDVDRDGLYRFSTESDDGSALFVGERRVVANDGSHGMRVRGGYVGLRTGRHPVRVEYFEGGLEAGILVRWSGPGLAEQVIPSDRWVHHPPEGGDDGDLFRTVLIDGVNDFGAGNLFDADGGDTEIGGFCSESAIAPYDIGDVFVTNDDEFLYFGIEYDRYCFCDGNLGIAIDVDTADGGATDPFLRRISWQAVDFRPDFYLYDVVPTQCNGFNYEVLYTWTGAQWTVLHDGADGLGIADGPFTEGRIPLSTLGVGRGDTVRLEFFLTAEGVGSGPYDAVCSDDVQLSTPAGTQQTVAQPVSMRCLKPYVVRSPAVPVLVTSSRGWRDEFGAVELEWLVAGPGRFEVHRGAIDGAPSRLALVSTAEHGRLHFRDDEAPAGELEYWLVETSGSSAGWFGPTRVTAARTDRSRVLQNTPNPFADTTTIRYRLAQTGPVRLRVIDLAGREVRRLVDGVREAGIHSSQWDGRDGDRRAVAAGVYFYRLEVEGRVEVRRLVLVRR